MHTIIIAGILLLIVAIASGYGAKYLHKARKSRSKKPLYYGLGLALTGFLFGGYGFLPEANLPTWPQLWFVLLAGVSLLIGYLHFRSLYTRYVWAIQERFWPEGLISLMLWAVFGLSFLAGFALVRFIFFKPVEGQELSFPLALYMLTATPVFLLPFILSHIYRRWEAIPVKIYSVWRYPLYAASASFPQRPFIVGFVKFRIRHGDVRLVQERVDIASKAPLGEFFRSFIDEYNRLTPSEPIRDYITNAAGEKIGWLFYGQRPGQPDRLLNSDLTIEENLLRDQDSLLAIRTTDQQLPDQDIPPAAQQPTTPPPKPTIKVKRRNG